MNLRRNGALSAAEVIVNGLALFLIYRNVVGVLGVSMLGVWSLVLATTAFGRAADLGISGGLSRFIAGAMGQRQFAQALSYMRTGLLFMLVAMAIVSLALWWPLWAWLSIALHGVELDAARSVLPWAILNLWLLIQKAGVDSCLIGLHRADLKATSGIAGMLVQLVFSYLLVRDYGLFGLAWAQAGQFVVALTMELVFLATVARIPRTARSAWFSWSAMREMFGFGVKLQAGTVANVAFEPAVKAVVAALAGTHVLGILEMTYRMSYQVRNVATTALQPTVAAFASLIGSNMSEAAPLFRTVTRTAAVSAAVLMAGVVAGAPLLSLFYLDRVDPLFVYMCGVFALMWGVTIIASPAYYYGIASGRVAPYVASEFVSVGLSCAAVVILSGTGSAPAMVVGVSLGKVVGSLMLGALTRPESGWGSSALANRATWASLAALLAICGGAIALSLHYM